MAIKPIIATADTMAKKSSTKKRKAETSTSGISDGQIKVQVEPPAPGNDPIVVSFPCGLPESLQPSAPPGASFAEFQWGKLSRKSAAGRKLIGQDKNCTYSASAAGLGYDDRRTKLCVGIYDKKRGTLVIREAASRGTVFSLQQSVPSYLEKNGPIQFKAGQNLLTYDTQVYEDFGSAKKRKVLKSQAANRVEINNVVGAGEGSAVMQQVIQGESMSESNRLAIAASRTTEEEAPANGSGNKAIDAAYEAARRKFLPKYDETAIKPHKVYSARDIAGEVAWKRVYNKVHACMNDEDPAESIVGIIFENDWNASVMKLVKAINVDSDDCKDRYTCALLTNHAIRFYSSNQKRKSVTPVNLTQAKYFGIPVEVASQWMKLFTTSEPGEDGKMRHVMSKQDKDRCVVHVLLLFIMAHGKAMKIPDIKPIANDLKVPINDCAQILRLAGCQVVKKGNALSVALTTPLTFPRPKRSVNKK